MAEIIVAISLWCGSEARQCKMALTICVLKKKGELSQGTDDDFLWECITERLNNVKNSTK